MNNEIILRTSKGEYHPGQTVYGGVYLNVCRPTEANGIKISFRALETCVYEYECHGNKKLKNETAHVDFSDVNLYSQADCFDFGSYVFPFKFDLPKEIPGTFQYLGHTSKTSWEVQVTYTLNAKAAGADILQTSQLIVIYQVQEEALKDSKWGSACSVSYETTRFFLRRQKIHITARLIENYQTSGSNMQLRLIVTNPTKLKVKSFRILLLRYLKLYVREKMADKMLDNMEYNSDVFHIAPENGPHIVYSREGDLGSFDIDSLELDQLQIPLRERLLGEDTETDIPPSVVGTHVKNQYQLEITIVFENNYRKVFNLKVPGVLPEKNQQWLQWRPPDWTFKAECKLSRSLFSVQESTLRTEAFSGLPTFQVL
uniref:Uncharacterized protein n=1 Tax=Arion vulgaris TaxID=1028688 RepID=A0A0B6ZEX9_9EUPU